MRRVNFVLILVLVQLLFLLVLAESQAGEVSPTKKLKNVYRDLADPGNANPVADRDAAATFKKTLKGKNIHPPKGYLFKKVSEEKWALQFQDPAFVAGTAWGSPGKISLRWATSDTATSAATFPMRATGLLKPMPGPGGAGGVGGEPGKPPTWKLALSDAVCKVEIRKPWPKDNKLLVTAGYKMNAQGFPEEKKAMYSWDYAGGGNWNRKKSIKKETTFTAPSAYTPKTKKDKDKQMVTVTYTVGTASAQDQKPLNITQPCHNKLLSPANPVIFTWTSPEITLANPNMDKPMFKKKIKYEIHDQFREKMENVEGGKSSGVKEKHVLVREYPNWFWKTVTLRKWFEDITIAKGWKGYDKGTYSDTLTIKKGQISLRRLIKKNKWNVTDNEVIFGCGNPKEKNEDKQGHVHKGTVGTKNPSGVWYPANKVKERTLAKNIFEGRVLLSEDKKTIKISVLYEVKVQ